MCTWQWDVLRLLCWFMARGQLLRLSEDTLSGEVVIHTVAVQVKGAADPSWKAFIILVMMFVPLGLTMEHCLSNR